MPPSILNKTGRAHGFFFFDACLRITHQFSQIKPAAMESDLLSQSFEESEMISAIKSSLAILGAAASLVACTSSVKAPKGNEAVDAMEPGAGVVTSDIASDLCDLRGPGKTIDAYKIGVAHRISRSNLGNTFEGRLPPMLPAVVVLRISVDSMGKVIETYVQRSRDAAASKIALASIQRSGNLPLPCGLINDRNPILSFSETFLFNDQYQFQLRSIAGPQ